MGWKCRIIKAIKRYSSQYFAIIVFSYLEALASKEIHPCSPTYWKMQWKLSFVLKAHQRADFSKYIIQRLEMNIPTYCSKPICSFLQWNTLRKDISYCTSWSSISFGKYFQNWHLSINRRAYLTDFGISQSRFGTMGGVWGELHTSTCQTQQVFQKVLFLRQKQTFKKHHLATNCS